MLLLSLIKKKSLLHDVELKPKKKLKRRRSEEKKIEKNLKDTEVLHSWNPFSSGDQQKIKTVKKFQAAKAGQFFSWLNASLVFVLCFF